MIYSIGEVSKKLDLPQSTIRYYEKMGLLPEIKRKNGNRIFSEDDLEIIDFISCLRTSGFSIEEMIQFSRYFYGSDDLDFSKRLEMMSDRRNKLLNQISELEQSIDYLDTKVEHFKKLAEANI